MRSISSKKSRKQWPYSCCSCA